MKTLRQQDMIKLVRLLNFITLKPQCPISSAINSIIGARCHPTQVITNSGDLSFGVYVFALILIGSLHSLFITVYSRTLKCC